MTGPAPEFDGKAFARGLTGKPGVYRMLDVRSEVIYVGKARNLKKRVSSYFRPLEQHGPKTRAMVMQIAAVEVTVTHTESEALILESNLIKELRPRYNILLRDDKSYPYIYLSSDQAFPRLSFHRGARRGKGRYFGPYPSAGAVRESLNLLQKVFRIRQCEDSFFRNRSRPCLQYQIGRCTGPCVGLIEAGDYARDVADAVLFLESRSQEVIDTLVGRMQAAAEAMDYERAAHIRDQIYSLKRVQERQHVSGQKGDIDIITACLEQGTGCVGVAYVRGGRSLGNKIFFPAHTRDADLGELLSAFMAQYYLSGHHDRRIPALILVNAPVPEQELLSEVLTTQSGRKVHIQSRVRGEKARWLELGLKNTELALQRQLADTAGTHMRMAALQLALDLDEPIERIECFDISHTQGEATVASCVVFDADGARKSDYRRFNIRDITPGDDYAAMHQALERRYTRVRREEGILPDVLLIDGGAGQVEQAHRVMADLQIDAVKVVGVAKGPSRRPGLETLVLSSGGNEFRLPPDDVALLLIQQVRDEAHRFAITGHRQRRGKARRVSTLEQIAGIGAKRRQHLLQHFGGLQGVTRAGVEDLAHAPGISRQLAQKIYDVFHDGA